MFLLIFKKIKICVLNLFVKSLVESMPIKYQQIPIFYIILQLSEFRIFKEPSPN
jgi:hypothetical protein